MIDIGGPTLARAAAKNYPHVAAISRPDQYVFVLDELRQSGELSEETRRQLEEAKDSAQAIEILSRLSELAKEVEAELSRARREAEAEADAGA